MIIPITLFVIGVVLIGFLIAAGILLDDDAKTKQRLDKLEAAIARILDALENK